MFRPLHRLGLCAQRWSSTLAAHLGDYKPRTHTCGQLNESLVDSRVSLCGWLVNNRKVSNNLGFFVLQDSHGQIQLIARKAKTKSTEVLEQLDRIPLQSTLQVSGIVRRRLPSAVTPGPAGAIEVMVDDIRLLNPAKEKLPFSPNDELFLPNEEFRLRHRYLDLRRPKLSSNLQKRSQISHTVRNYLHEQGFVEVETPMLLKSTPEGAREYLVPTRTSKFAPTNGSETGPTFYALSQSPQQPKQILVSSGTVEKYYQFARCFRDEDGRADRQPEFTQIDLEMGWVSWGPKTPGDIALTNEGTLTNPAFSEWRIGGSEVRDVIEGIMRRIWQKSLEFPIMRYKDAMIFYGSDKPDLRWAQQLIDFTSLLPAASQAYLAQSMQAVEALLVPECDPKSLDLIIDKLGLSGTEIYDLQDGKVQIGPNSLFILDGEECIHVPHSEEHARLVLATRPVQPQGGWTTLGRLRAALVPWFASKEDLQSHRFLWVTEFPLFTREDEDKQFLAHGRWSSSHHPFTAPMIEDLELLRKGGSGLTAVRGQHYDLVLNGMEIAGGSVRIHDASLQEYIFEHILELTRAERAGFSVLLDALRCGAPPHAGVAIGFDRLMSILCNEPSIRNVMAFPKTAGGTDLLFSCPAPVPKDTLELYGLQPLVRAPASD